MTDDDRDHRERGKRGRGPALSRRSLIAGVAGAAGLGVGATAIARSADSAGASVHGGDVIAVSYTHLTLPTILRV